MEYPFDKKGGNVLKKVIFNAVHLDERHLFLDYLLAADEDEEMVKEYIYEGEMYSINIDGKIAGAVLFTFHSEEIVELKNIAIAEQFQGIGLGKSTVLRAFELYRLRGFKKMIVGTANSSIGNLAFYQKAGFRMEGIKKDFFLKYPEPIYENGIRAIDMVMFEKNLC
jgi:ribosomal protein S18 acetylase RimI-like enzyme